MLLCGSRRNFVSLCDHNVSLDLIRSGEIFSNKLHLATAQIDGVQGLDLKVSEAAARRRFSS